jgi:hypothetical protein
MGNVSYVLSTYKEEKEDGGTIKFNKFTSACILKASGILRYTHRSNLPTKMNDSLQECEFLRPLSPYSDFSALSDSDMKENKRASLFDE